MSTAVVIPVHADPDGLLVTLSGLRDVQVVVIVDGAHAATERVASQAGARVVVLPESRGSYAARNAGIDTLGPDVTVVLFTDAGCAIQPGWADAHLVALREADLTGGAVVVTTRRRPSPAEWVDHSRNLRQQAYVEGAGFAATCNLGARRELLERVRFDPQLRSGGDRELCLRATAGGARLRYVPDAVVHHPARRSSRAVLAKARRVGAGLAAQPPALRATPPSPARVNGGLARRARAEGHRVGAVWALRAGWLDRRRACALRAAALAPPPVAGLHVVVLLGSRWASLEHMNTRWRQVGAAWATHPEISRLTLVDHPRFRPGARHLVAAAPSWLPGPDLLDLTVPTTLRPGPLDRLAWWRAARALHQALPDAQRRLVVCASPVAAPLLAHLRRSATPTTTAFDVVDVWRNLAVEGDPGARLEAGFSGVSGADHLTAVSGAVAEGLRRWTTQPVTPVANGVDLQEYAEKRPAPAGLPVGPFAVYVGSLSSRLDVELVTEAARLLCDDLPVVLAGPATVATADLLAQSPAIWLGPVATHLVPGLLQRAAVGLFLHRLTDHTEASDSMKLLEYAAAGLPVVATDLPGLPPGAVVATGPQEVATQVRRLAAHPRESQPEPWVRDRDWAVVADQLLHELSGRSVPVREQAVVR